MKEKKTRAAVRIAYQDALLNYVLTKTEGLKKLNKSKLSEACCKHPIWQTRFLSYNP